ncbi:MAG: Gfo/Idh/MocA family protein [Chloroflexota bacterium]
MERVRVGLIGASVRRGWGMSAHVPALTHLPELELTAVCTAHSETARESAEAFGARLAFSDYREIIQSPEVDAVTIAVRVPWHKEIALAAAAAGKHVYCEWPLAVTVEDGEAMQVAADAAGVQHMVGLQGRAAPWARYLHDLVSGGELGEIIAVNASSFTTHNYMRADTHWAAKRAAGNHLLSIQVGHMLDMLESMLGPLTGLKSRIGTRVTPWLIEGLEPIEADAPDHVLISGQFASGGIASLHSAYVPVTPGAWRLEIYGDRGAVRASASGPSHVATMRLERGQPGASAMEPISVPAEYSEVPDAVPQGAPFHVAHLYRRFARAILSGEPAEPSFADGVRRLKSLDALG